MDFGNFLAIMKCELADGRPRLEEPKNSRMREILHDLSNVITGISVTGGLLQSALQGDRRQHYAVDICVGTDRGAELVRKGRSLLAEINE